jgi:hypothetical protein
MWSNHIPSTVIIQSSNIFIYILAIFSRFQAYRGNIAIQYLEVLFKVYITWQYYHGPFNNMIILYDSIKHQSNWGFTMFHYNMTQQNAPYKYYESLPRMKEENYNTAFCLYISNTWFLFTNSTYKMHRLQCFYLQKLLCVSGLTGPSSGSAAVQNNH